MTEFNKYAVTSGNTSKLDSILVLKHAGGKSREGHLFVTSSGVMPIWSDDTEFIAGFKILSTKTEKLLFAMASLCGQVLMPDGETIIIHEEENISRNIVQIQNIIKKIKPGFKKFDLRDNSAAKYGLIKASTDGLLEKFLDTHKITLEEFVDNARYEVLTDCGGSMFEQLKRLKLIDMDLVEEEYRGQEA